MTGLMREFAGGRGRRRRGEESGRDCDRDLPERLGGTGQEAERHGRAPSEGVQRARSSCPQCIGEHASELDRDPIGSCMQFGRRVERKLQPGQRPPLQI